MIAGIGLGAETASLFHLWTHAFFKAGLFLGAGIVVDYMRQRGIHDAENMTLMGRTEISFTFYLLGYEHFCIGTRRNSFFFWFYVKRENFTRFMDKRSISILVESCYSHFDDDYFTNYSYLHF